MDAMKAMNKSTKKTNSYNTAVLTRLSEIYGFSKVYIRQCLDGTRTAEVSDRLKKDYKRMDNAVKEALK